MLDSMQIDCVFASYSTPEDIDIRINPDMFRSSLSSGSTRPVDTLHRRAKRWAQNNKFVRGENEIEMFKTLEAMGILLDLPPMFFNRAVEIQEHLIEHYEHEEEEDWEDE